MFLHVGVDSPGVFFFGVELSVHYPFTLSHLKCFNCSFLFQAIVIYGDSAEEVVLAQA